MKSSRGFTLIEIMIALAVFAVVSAALIKNATVSVKQTVEIKDKTVAYWVAENQLAQMRSGPHTAESFPPAGTNRYTVSMAGKDWEVSVTTVATDNPDVRRINVSVFRETDLEHDVAELTGFYGRY